MRTPGSSGQQGSSSGQDERGSSWSWSWCRAMMGLLAAELASLALPSLLPGAGASPVAVAVAALVALMGLVAGAVLALVAVDGLAAGPPRPALREVAGVFGLDNSVKVGVGVGVAVVLQPSGGLPPCALAAGGLRWLAEQLRQPGGPLELQRAAGRAAVPAELADHGGVADRGGLMAFQERGALLLLAAQLDKLPGGLIGHPRHLLGHGHGLPVAGGPADGAEHPKCSATPSTARRLRGLLDLAQALLGLAVALLGQADPLRD